jgi:hypothetical protein
MASPSFFWHGLRELLAVPCGQVARRATKSTEKAALSYPAPALAWAEVSSSSGHTRVLQSAGQLQRGDNPAAAFAGPQVHASYQGVSCFRVIAVPRLPRVPLRKHPAPSAPVISCGDGPFRHRLFPAGTGQG